MVGLLELAPQLERPLRALPVQATTLHVLSSVNEAVEEAAQLDRSAGLFGALGALGDPKVKRALGFLLEVAKRLGSALDEPPRSLPSPSKKKKRKKKRSKAS